MIPAKYWSPTRKLMLLGAMAGGKAVEDTATGNPLTFLTDLARPLKSLLVPFTPKQTGSGDPSPSNIRPIVAWDGVKVWNGGKNLFGTENLLRGYINATGEIKEANNNILSQFIPYVYGTKITAYIDDTINGGVTSLGVAYYDEDGNYITRDSQGVRNVPYTFNVYQRNGNGFIRIWMNRDNESHTIEEHINFGLYVQFGDNFSSYEPYQPITETDISFPSTVYGGTLDVVSGVLTERRYQNVKYKWSEGRSATVVGNVERRGFIVPSQAKTESELDADITARFCNVAQWKYNYSSDDVHYYGGGYSFYVFLPVGTDENLEIQLVVERTAQPQEIQLTPAQITALVGNNTIWSDADGDMTAVFFKKG